MLNNGQYSCDITVGKMVIFIASNWKEGQGRVNYDNI